MRIQARDNVSKINYFLFSCFIQYIKKNIENKSCIQNVYVVYALRTSAYNFHTLTSARVHHIRSPSLVPSIFLIKKKSRKNLKTNFTDRHRT